MSWFSNQWNRFVGQDDDPNMPIRRVEVVWGRERLLIPVNEQSPGQATLRQLKEEIVRQTSVPYEQIKLIIGGLILKDDRAPLAAYNVRNGSRLTLVGTSGGVPASGDMPGVKSSAMEGKMSKGEELARRKKESEQDMSEQGLLRRIEEALAGVRKDLVPEVLEFEQAPKDVAASEARAKDGAIGNGPSSPAATAQRHEGLARQHRKLSELLLRVLLALDGINVNSDETRKRRKEAVKEVQGYLDRVDGTWSSLKHAIEHRAAPA